MQQLANEFNQAYLKAIVSSNPFEYMQATMLARQLVLELGENLVLDDNYDTLISKRDKERN